MRFIVLFIIGLLSCSLQAKEIELVSIFMVGGSGDELRHAPKNHQCDGFYTVKQALSIPNADSNGIRDWNDTVQTPTYGKVIEVITQPDQRSWLFDVVSDSMNLPASVGFGLFCVRA